MTTRSFLAAAAVLLAGPACGDYPSSPTPALPRVNDDAAAASALTFWQVSGGWVTTCGVTTSNQAYCWGNYNYGTVGDGTTGSNRYTPVAVVGGLAFRHVSVGGTHACGVTTDNRAYCWGFNGFGQLGDGTLVDKPRPTPVAGGHPFAQIDAGHEHTCAIEYGSGLLYCWGDNAQGQLGDGTLTQHARPARVSGGRSYRLVSGGRQHTCAVTTTYASFCWGYNYFGALGDSTTLRRKSPTRVVGTQQWWQVDAGMYHTCAVTITNQAFCWGHGRQGQVGNGKATGKNIWPQAVAGGLAFRRVTTGDSHTCGETPANKAYCWGLNFAGALGDGTTASRLRPVAVAGGLSFKQLDAGSYFTCGKTVAAVGYCWGENEQTTLGDGTAVDRLTPTPIAGPM